MEPEIKQPVKKRFHFVVPVMAGMAVFVLVMFAWLLGWNPLHYLLSSPSVPAETVTLNELSGSDDVISRSYDWSYDNRSWTWNLAIPKDLYDYYRSIERAPVADYSIYVTHPLDDIFCEELASRLSEEAGNRDFDSLETLQFAAAFVQDLAYLSEVEEYPKYPIETLVDKGGDCEDTAILMAALLHAMGYDAVLVNLSSPYPGEPGHMAVGVAFPGLSQGTMFTYENIDYYYLETTCVSKLGYMPEDYVDHSVSIYRLVSKPILRLSSLKWSIWGWPMNTLTLDTTVTNWGTADAHEAYVRAFFYGNESGAKSSALFDLEFGHRLSHVTVERLEVPSRGETLCVQLVLDGKVVDEWFAAVQQ